MNEIGIMSGLQHPNLVRLYGCCIEGKQLLLVYEYMENNSLAHALFNNGKLVFLYLTMHQYIYIYIEREREREREKERERELMQESMRFCQMTHSMQRELKYSQVLYQR